MMRQHPAIALPLGPPRQKIRCSVDSAMPRGAWTLAMPSKTKSQNLIAATLQSPSCSDNGAIIFVERILGCLLFSLPMSFEKKVHMMNLQTIFCDMQL